MFDNGQEWVVFMWPKLCSAQQDYQRKSASHVFVFQIDTIRARCALLLSQMKRIRGLLDIDDNTDHNQQWKRYRTAIASCLG
jgi:hypothetical protein